MPPWSDANRQTDALTSGSFVPVVHTDVELIHQGPPLAEELQLAADSGSVNVADLKHPIRTEENVLGAVVLALSLWDVFKTADTTEWAQGLSRASLEIHHDRIGNKY